MKYFLFFLILFLYAKLISAQEYIFPLHFEDSAGNKDTLLFGFDHSATSGIDENLGEVNILGQPYDSAFFAFFSDAVLRDDSYCNLSQEKAPTFILKNQYLNKGSGSVIEAGLIGFDWPVKISWDTIKIKSFEQNYSQEEIYLIITSWHPPGGWFDAKCCQSNWPGGYTFMSQKSSLELNKETFCRYKTGNFKDSVNLFYIGIEQYTALDDIRLNQKKISCMYDKYSQSIKIFNKGDYPSIRIELYNMLGKKVLLHDITEETGQQSTFKINLLTEGMFIIHISDLKTLYPISNHKILIK